MVKMHARGAIDNGAHGVMQRPHQRGALHCAAAHYNYGGTAMKATINGITYDSTKARYIDGYTITRSRSEAHEVCEYMYQMPTGEYFTGRLGGAATAYAAGEITPMSPSAARNWLAEHISEARAKELFGLTEQAAQGITLTINISQAAAAEITAAVLSALPALNIAPLRRALGELIG